MAAKGISALAVAFLLCSSAAVPGADAAVACPQVISSLVPCLPYIRGRAGQPAPACCNGVSAINSQSRTTADRRSTCSCLKTLVSKLQGINLSLAGGLPAKCGVSVPYPISLKTDCTTIT